MGTGASTLTCLDRPAPILYSTALHVAAPAPPRRLPSRATQVALAAVVCAAAAILRTWDISRHFWLLGDQIRDWKIALGPFSDLPLVGPATHVGGYTIGPAFYWLLWMIRVLLGPWFENLPHAGGIGQAWLQSGADALLLVAIWRRTGSLWIALAAVVLLVTAPYDLALSPLVWNPVMGSTLAKVATALVLLAWPDRSLARVAITAAVAWGAVHCYTGTIFVALSVFAALVAAPIVRREWQPVFRRGLVVWIVVVALQIPYVVHRVWIDPAGPPGMGVVAESLASVASGGAIRLQASVTAYAHALNGIQLRPRTSAATGWFVLACGFIVAARYRRDPVLLAVTILPQLAAIGGYALWLGDFDDYYYLSLMPAAVLTVLLGVTALTRGRASQPVAIALLVAALAIAPGRVREAGGIHKMPEYDALVRASRAILARAQGGGGPAPVQRIEAPFLPPTGDPSFVYWILGGRLDAHSPWVATIAPEGQVSYRRVDSR